MTIEVIDNFLPPDVAVEFSRNFFEDKSWNYGWNMGLSESEQRAWNWHRSVGNDTVNMGQMSQVDLDDNLSVLWEYTDEMLMKLSGVKHKMDRYYSNSHTYGIEGPIHRDDGSLTCLYYPCENWQVEWEGGTAFYNEEMDDAIQYASYRFNRMIIFDAKIPHRAMPTTRECYRLRTSIVFKTSMDVTHPSYVEWYNKK